MNKFFLALLGVFISFFVQASTVVPGGEFSGSGNLGGVDGFGHEWFYDSNDDGSRLIWSMPGLGEAGSFFGPQNSVNGFFIEFHDNSLVIDMTPSLGEEDFEYRTQFLHVEPGWTSTLSKQADRVRIDFTAPENIFLNIGDDFSAMIVFGNLYDPSTFSFIAGWLHIDGNGEGTVAEPSTLILFFLVCSVFFIRFCAGVWRYRI